MVGSLLRGAPTHRPTSRYSSANSYRILETRVHRRAFLKAAGAAAALGTADTVWGTDPAVADVSQIRDWVPEIFAPLPDPPEHSPVIIIGSGFGAAVTALRLSQAGVANTVLERGSRWPTDPWRDVFCSDDLPDGRGYWHRTSFTTVSKVTAPCDYFGGVLDTTDFGGIQVWRGAAVGGGSIVYTGCMIAPERRWFDDMFGGSVDYTELDTTYYPRVRNMLRLSPMPADVYGSAPFTHSRQWDAQIRKAGYEPTPSDSGFNWDILRAELAGAVQKSATIGRSNLGNSNGAKFDLTQNYLRYAEDTGNTAIYPGHQVNSIQQDPNGTYVVTVAKLDPSGTVLATRTLTCDRLFLGAGSIGTTELLVRAQATGALPNLNEHIGDGWGTNGDVVLARGESELACTGFGVPSAGHITDTTGTPLTLENWYVPGNFGLDLGIVASLAIVRDTTRGRFGYDAERDTITLTWPKQAQDAVIAAARAVDSKIADAAGALLDYSIAGLDANAWFTAHPLGGAVLGQATDGYGRVIGHPGLYVTDGAGLPGSAGLVNPALTIAAIAERNIEEIIRAGK
ncbi:GMC family oxidoreductase [Nocardia stercoris]|uniref:Cholesterol oxidase n=1 Tax=Nocardia stercoris TaxID=2483361 RepID=A0A3M2LI55_9NOCA|nr:GMC family oxidoreductase [Nocardia stercoris]